MYFDNFNSIYVCILKIQGKDQCAIAADFPNNEIWTRCNNPKWTDVKYPKWEVCITKYCSPDRVNMPYLMFDTRLSIRC